MYTPIAELANQIKAKGRAPATELVPLLEQAERIASTEGAESLTRALALRAAGNVLRLMDRYDDSLQRYQTAAAILEALGERSELARTLHACIVPLAFLSRIDDLFVCSKKAQTLFAELRDNRGLARLNVNLAHAFHRLDRHVESLQCSENARTVLEQCGDTEGFLAACVNSALTLTVMHRFEAAEDAFQQALKTATAVNKQASVLLCRHNLAYLRYLRGNTTAALDEYARLRAEYQRTGDDWQLLRCWLDEAEILLEIGDLDEAIELALAARQGAEKLRLNSELGRALLFEAAAHIRSGRPDKAAPLLEKAARLFVAEGNDTQVALSGLQTLALTASEPDPAIFQKALKSRGALERAGLPNRIAFADIVIGRQYRALGDELSAQSAFESSLTAARESGSHWMQFHANYELGISLARLRRPDAVSHLRTAEQMLDTLWDKLGSDDLKVAFMTDRENVYTHLVPQMLKESDAAAFVLSEKARSRVLQERLAGPGSICNIQNIQMALGPDDLIVEYFVAGHDICIFTLDHSGVSCTVEENCVERVAGIAEQLDRHLSSCSLKWERLEAARQHLETTARTHLHMLYDELIAPIRSRLRKNVIIVPHDRLHAIPFHALFDGTHFLGDEFTVTYSPSATLYAAPAPAVEHYEAPLFIAFSGRGQSSAEEVVEAASHFHDAIVLIDPSMSTLRDHFARPHRIVHLAGHAGIDSVAGKLSWIETPEGRLSGRALAEMRIQAKTIVITGCQTARRIIRPGDEWQGLMRAFYESGASAIVSAFWDIRSESAKRFSSAFYSVFDGSRVSEAVRAASATLKEWRSHPYFWSGFGAFVRRICD